MAVIHTLNMADVMRELKQDYDDELRYALEALKSKMIRYRANSDAIVRISRVLPEECRLVIEEKWQLNTPKVSFPVEALPKVWKAVGKMTVKCKALVNAQKRLVRVTLVSLQWPEFEFEYTKVLPEDTKGRCQIKETTSTIKQLVCTI